MDCFLPDLALLKIVPCPSIHYPGYLDDTRMLIRWRNRKYTSIVPPCKTYCPFSPNIQHILIRAVSRGMQSSMQHVLIVYNSLIFSNYFCNVYWLYIFYLFSGEQTLESTKLPLLYPLDTHSVVKRLQLTGTCAVVYIVLDVVHHATCTCVIFHAV